MRPVNLIPPDARRGDLAALRRGPASYIVIAALALALLGAIALAFTSKQVSDRKDEVARLTQEQQQAQARAESLQAFTTFAGMQQDRARTVTGLAKSRFDWNRVLNELARVIPADVWLVQMKGTVSPDVDLESTADIDIRDSVPGPALEIIGCAPSQDAVAGFVADLEDIDGVTRVGVASSERQEQEQGQSAAPAVTGDSTGDSGDCRTKEFISRFEIVVAFDNVPAPAESTAAPSVPAAPTTGSSQQLASSGSQSTAPASSSSSSSSSVPGG